jgi:glycosyltransferase involved in cell wall biosynthesis
VSEPIGATPAVSVVIPARDEASTLPALLRSLQAQTLERERFEVIVVDNDSSDDTAAVAAGHGAKVVHEPVANRSRARNHGVAAASAPLYAFTDADCVADPRWLEALLRCAPSAPLQAGAVEVTVGERPNALERFELLWRFGQEEWVKQGWAATANLLVHREAFDAIGGFDPAWREGGEDADFCVRAGRAGHALAYCGDALVRHYGERRLRPFLRRFFMHGYSVNQARYRLGIGYRAWRHPLPALVSDRALRQIGHSPNGFEPAEWRRMARIARLGYAARVVGSVWAEIVRAR